MREIWNLRFVFWKSLRLLVPYMGKFEIWDVAFWNKLWDCCTYTRYKQRPVYKDGTNGGGCEIWNLTSDVTKPRKYVTGRTNPFKYIREATYECWVRYKIKAAQAHALRVKAGWQIIFRLAHSPFLVGVSWLALYYCCSGFYLLQKSNEPFARWAHKTCVAYLSASVSTAVTW